MPIPEIDQRALKRQLMDLNYALYKAGRHDLQGSMRKVNMQIATDWAERAKQIAPEDTGRLKLWLRPKATAVRARVEDRVRTRSGGDRNRRVYYARFTEFGTRKIRSQAYVRKVYDRNADKYFRWLIKGIDRVSGRFNRGR